MRSGLKLFICCVMLSACSPVEKVEPEISFLDDNALLLQIRFETTDSAEFMISYWPVNKPHRIQNSPMSYGTDHNIILMNLKPATQYDFIISNKSSGNKSKPFSFETKALPADITSTDKHTVDTTQFNGFILVRGLAPKGADVIIDNEGDVVWYHQYDKVVRRPFSWTKDNTILSIYDSADIVEYDLKGKQLLNLRLEEKDIQHKLHHDIVFSDVGNIVTLTHDSLKMDLRKLGGNKNQYLRADGILVLTPAGKIEWVWNLLQTIDPLKLDPRLVDINSLGHANSIAIDRDGHYLVSFRDFSQIWKINSKDGSVIWKLGEGGDLKMDRDAFFIRQHSAFVDAAGDLMLFDNGDRKNRPYSRILSFSINETTRVAKTKVNIKLNSELSADKMCSVEQLEDEKFLVCTTKRNGIISVVDGEGNVLWKVNLTKPSYRAYYLRNPFESLRGSSKTLAASKK
jgi:arylsulfate sulfotransferase